MKNYLLLAPLLALAAPAAAQHTEIQARAGVGLSRFGGPSAQSTSFVNYSEVQDYSYTNSPYGSRWGTGVALGARVERVGAHSGLLAFDLGYEWLQSRTSITALSGPLTRFSSYAGRYAADGSTALQTHNLTGFLGIGHRFGAGKLNVDALAGPEIAYVFGFREKGSGSFDYNGRPAWSTDVDHRAANRTDARLRADVTVWYQQLGFNASYSHGLLNYQSGLVGGSPQVYARVLRLGLAYRLH